MANNNNEESWVHIAIVGIRNEISELKAEVSARFAKIETAQEDYAKKEYAARLVGRILHRVIRLCWYATIAVGGFALTNWSKIKAYIEGVK